MSRISFTLAINIAFLLVKAPAIQAQSATPAPKVGYLRFWDMVPAASGTFDLTKAGANGPEIVLAGTPFQYSVYRQFPIGRYKLQVTKKGVPTPLQVYDIDLRADTFFTIIVGPQGPMLVDDTNDPKSASASLTIRNFFPGTTVSVSQAEKTVASNIAYGQSVAASGFPFRDVEFTVTSLLPNGRPVSSGAEADFRQGKRATILVIPDTYGRFRPRTTLDGRNQF